MSGRPSGPNTKYITPASFENTHFNNTEPTNTAIVYGTRTTARANT